MPRRGSSSQVHLSALQDEEGSQSDTDTSNAEYKAYTTVKTIKRNIVELECTNRTPASLCLPKSRVLRGIFGLYNVSLSLICVPEKVHLAFISRQNYAPCVISQIVALFPVSDIACRSLKKTRTELSNESIAVLPYQFSSHDTAAEIGSHLIASLVCVADHPPTILSANWNLTGTSRHPGACAAK